jgi:hypothetical protein
VAPCREATEIVLASEVVGERLLEEKMEEGQSFLEVGSRAPFVPARIRSDYLENPSVCADLAFYSEGEVARPGTFKDSARTRRLRMADSTLFFAVQTSNNC